MSTFREAMFHLVGITEDDLDTPHVDEYAGTEYVTPSIIREEDHGEAAEAPRVRPLFRR